MGTEAEKEQLKHLYFTLLQPSSFGGVQPLVRNSRLHKNVVDDWLPYQDAYTLHKPVRRNYPRNQTRVAGIDDQWQADLVDMRTYEKYNQGINYILTIIDIFSKHAWAVPLERKTVKTHWSRPWKVFSWKVGSPWNSTRIKAQSLKTRKCNTSWRKTMSTTSPPGVTRRQQWLNASTLL